MTRQVTIKGLDYKLTDDFTDYDVMALMPLTQVNMDNPEADIATRMVEGWRSIQTIIEDPPEALWWNAKVKRLKLHVSHVATILSAAMEALGERGDWSDSFDATVETMASGSPQDKAIAEAAQAKMARHRAKPQGFAKPADPAPVAVVENAKPQTDQEKLLELLGALQKQVAGN